MSERGDKQVSGPAGLRLEVGVGLLTAGAAGLLVFSVLSSLRTTERAIEAVDRGAATTVLHQVQLELRALRRRPDPTDMQAVLRKLRPEGLRYVAVGPANGPAGTSAGKAMLSKIADRQGVTQLGPRVRITVPMPPPRDGRGPPGGAARAGGPPAGGGPPGAGPGRAGPPGALGLVGPPHLTVEVYSPLSSGLVQEARRGVAVGAAAALLLVIGGGLIVVLLRRARRSAAAQAEQAQLAALGRMSAVVAHEIKNPLASLKGHAQLLAERLEGPRDKKKAERVVREAQRLEEIVKGLRAFLQSGRVDPATVDVAALVGSVAAEVGGEIELKVPQDGLSFPVDAHRLRHAISNLLQNAVEAGGPVELELSLMHGDLHLAVRDRGPGLPEDEDVFAAFVTTKTHGTGLGLTVVQAVVAAHGGIVAATPRRGGGTEIALRLPRTGR